MLRSHNIRKIFHFEVELFKKHNSYVSRKLEEISEISVGRYLSIFSMIRFFTGIPISQQHLIWQSKELEDDYCLHDYCIHDGATLKLVLALRGGPINTRRSEYAPCLIVYPTQRSSHCSKIISTSVIVSFHSYRSCLRSV